MNLHLFLYRTTLKSFTAHSTAAILRLTNSTANFIASVAFLYQGVVEHNCFQCDRRLGSIQLHRR